MNAETTLRPYKSNSTTHLVAHAPTTTTPTHHKPKLSLYNYSAREATYRIAQHHCSIQDLPSQPSYPLGQQMPCDYGGGHPLAINHPTEGYLCIRTPIQKHLE